MKNKRMISVLIVFILALLAVMTLMSAHNTFSTNPMHDLGVSKSFTEGWYTKIDGGNQSFIELENLSFKRHGAAKISIYHEMNRPDDGIQQSIALCTSGISFNIYLNDAIVSQSKVFSSESLMNKDPGYGWHFANLPPYNDGDVLRIDLYSYSYDGSEAIHDIYIGQSAIIFKSLIESTLPRLILCFILSLIGIFFVIMHIMFNKLLKVKLYMLYIGVFILLGGVYSSLHLTMPTLFVNDGEVLNCLEYLLLMVMPVFILRYVDKVCDKKNQTLINAAYIALICNFAAQNILNMATSLTFHRMLIMSHIVILFTVGVVMHTVEADRHVYEIGDTDAKIRKNLLFTGLIIMCTTLILDVFHLYLTKTQDASFFFRIGMIFLAITAAIINSIRVSDFTKRTAVSDLLREMAYTDQLTGLSNRSRFERRLDEIDAEKHEHETVAIVVFDVNNLKKVNDNHGHQDGDQLIKSAASAIGDVFVADFTSYRIGGDEFASIYSGNESRNYIEHRIEMFYQRVERANESVPEHLKLSIAVGVAFMSISTGENMSSVFRRADRIMYENKRKMKEKMNCE